MSLAVNWGLKRPFLTKWLGRTCGGVAAVMLTLWLFWPSLGYIIAASPDGRRGLIATAGQTEVLRYSKPSLLILMVRAAGNR